MPGKERVVTEVVAGREREFRTDNAFRTGRAGGDFRNWNRAGVRCDDAVVGDDGFEFFDDFVLDVDVFEDGFDYDVRFVEVLVVEGRFEVRQVFVFLDTGK